MKIIVATFNSAKWLPRTALNQLPLSARVRQVRSIQARPTRRLSADSQLHRCSSGGGAGRRRSFRSYPSVRAKRMCGRHLVFQHHYELHTIQLTHLLISAVNAGYTIRIRAHFHCNLVLFRQRLTHLYPFLMDHFRRRYHHVRTVRRGTTGRQYTMN